MTDRHAVDHPPGETARALQVACVVGARPNFMKMAPILRALENDNHARRVKTTLIHTGQHYDVNLSEIFFSELGLRSPDICLEVGSGTHAAQTARILERMETALRGGAPSGRSFDCLLVVGDVNSTLAAALAAAKLGILIAHVEAGLRSFDRSMPEEINRIVTDSISDLLFVSEPAGVENLLREGHPRDNVQLVGNVMIDSLHFAIHRARELAAAEKLGLQPARYGIVTLHRPSNVDDPEVLAAIVDVLIEISSDLPFVFPVHPRTQVALERAGLRARMEAAANLRLLDPLGYLSFLSLTSTARAVVTDSGGLQEETTALGIPCLTLRPNTERPVTVQSGTSTLIGSDANRLRSALNDVLNGNYKAGVCPALWDGRASHRIAEILVTRLSDRT
jgi:UDP-N-acetylglucosamine 2-epimerase (non-hydrolysing)